MQIQQHHAPPLMRPAVDPDSSVPRPRKAVVPFSPARAALFVLTLLVRASPFLLVRGRERKMRNDFKWRIYR